MEPREMQAVALADAALRRSNAPDVYRLRRLGRGRGRSAARTRAAALIRAARTLPTRRARFLACSSVVALGTPSSVTFATSTSG